MGDPVTWPRVGRARAKQVVAGPLIVWIVLLAIGVVGLRSARSAPLGQTAATTVAGGVHETDDAAGPPARLVSLGRRIFFDAALSEPAGTSCASCHDPARGYAGDNGSKRGVPAGSRPGHFARRSAPSVMYLGFVRPFHFHWEEDAPLPDAFGGFFWDGRIDSIAELVKQPLLNPDEMGNGDETQIRDKLAGRPYAGDLVREFPDCLASPGGALAAMGKAIEAFLKSPELSPFSSKYDAYVRGKTALTDLEAHGLQVFKDAAKGGCAECHKLNDVTGRPELSPFSDYGFETVSPPRNAGIPANGDPDHSDLGLCERNDPRTHTDESRLCGAFRTPSLRNVAVRPSFMHNGVFSKLRDVVAFYATRDTNPKRWYASGAAYEDLPAKFRANVNTAAAPYNAGSGRRPRLDDHDIDALVAFLETLTDPHPDLVAAPRGQPATSTTPAPGSPRRDARVP
jgi:cytochrome c peroxidase